jgi:NTE family protein
MRALVLSGGGSKGAYEAGVVNYLLCQEAREYDLFAGVSVGALNAAFLAQYPAGNRIKAADDLRYLWMGMDDSKVYKNWFLPYISALWKPSVYNSTPLQKLVRGMLEQPAPGKKLRVGATGLDSGTFRVFDETYPDVPTAVLASSAFPGMLCPVKVGGQLYTDGGVCSNTPLKQAIQAGATEIDVVLCSPLADPSNSFQTKSTTLDIAIRAVGLLTDSIQRDDLANVRGLRHDLKIRVVAPTKILVQNPLDFTPSLLQSMYGQGLADAHTQLCGVCNRP